MKKNKGAFYYHNKRNIYGGIVIFKHAQQRWLFPLSGLQTNEGGPTRPATQITPTNGVARFAHCLVVRSVFDDSPRVAHLAVENVHGVALAVAEGIDSSRRERGMSEVTLLPWPRRGLGLGLCGLVRLG